MPKLDMAYRLTAWPNTGTVGTSNRTLHPQGTLVIIPSRANKRYKVGGDKNVYLDNSEQHMSPSRSERVSDIEDFPALGDLRDSDTEGSLSETDTPQVPSDVPPELTAVVPRVRPFINHLVYTTDDNTIVPF